MFALMITIEDLQIVGQVRFRQIDGDIRSEWNLTLVDNHSGVSQEVYWSDEELAAVLALAISGDGDLGRELDKALYPIAEKACEGLPKELRPMP